MFEVWRITRDLDQIFYEGISFFIILELIWTCDERFYKWTIEFVYAVSNLFQDVVQRSDQSWLSIFLVDQNRFAVAKLGSVLGNEVYGLDVFLNKGL
jgi:hypothetical protein